MLGHKNTSQDGLTNSKQTNYISHQYSLQCLRMSGLLGKLIHKTHCFMLGHKNTSQDGLTNSKQTNLSSL